MAEVRFLVFDVESVADGMLISKIRFPGQQLGAKEAIAAYRKELIERQGNDFIPYSFQFPLAIAIAKVAEDYALIDLVVLDEPAFRPHVMTDYFWRGWEAYRRPTLVTFNGRGFDLPLLELAAFRYGLNIGGWLDHHGPTYQQPRYRYNMESHLDLCDTLTNFGAVRLHGGLNLTASLLGKPGKIDVQGDMVQDLYDEGKTQAIADYCRCDVLDTYFVLLRVAVMAGKLSLDREQQLIADTKQWLQERASTQAAYHTYLENWGDWPNPWELPRSPG
jgi:predicted PolB exonuclease-like 3'-5' exonuclease